MQQPLLSTLPSSGNSEAIFSEFFQMTGEIFTWLAPQVLSDLGIDAGNTNNAYLLSHFSPQQDYAAATTLIYTTQVAIVVIPSAFLYLIPVLIRFIMPEDKSAVITASVIFGVMLSLPGMVSGFFMDQFFLSLGNKASVCKIVGEYFSVFSFALPVWMIATALSKTAAPLNYKTLMYIESGINFLCMTGFSNLFVRAYTLPYLTPVQTIALSPLVCSVARIALYGMVYGYRGEFEKRQNVDFAKYQKAITALLTIGWRLGVQLTSELVALYFLPLLTTLLLPRSTVNLAVLNVLSQCFIFSIIITLSMAITAMNLVSDFRNKRDDKKVRPYVDAILVMSVIYNTILFVIAMAAPNTIVNVFMNAKENTNSGLSGDFRAMFAITYAGLVMNACKDIINMSQRSLDIYSLPMKASLGGVWGVGIPFAVLFATCTDLGVGGIWLGYNLGNIATGSFLLCHWALVIQPEVVQSIFYQGSEKAKEVDKISYGFRHWKTLFYQPLHQTNNETNTELIPNV